MSKSHGSGLPKGIRAVTNDIKQKLSALVIKARQHGYQIKEATIKKAEHADAVDKYVGHLKSFQEAMEENAAAVAGAGGTLELYKFPDRNTLGDASQSGAIRMSIDYVTQAYYMNDTLPHEHTHQLMNYLITKEMGFARGTSEYEAAYEGADAYISVNNAALKTWKTAEIANLNKSIADATAKGNSALNQFVVDGLKNQLVKVQAVSTPYEAAKLTGMRDYATRDYSWAPKGAGIEIPTVASENLVKAGYNWETLKQQSPYSYYVLQELKRRLK